MKKCPPEGVEAGDRHQRGPHRRHREMRIDKQICGAPNLLALPGCGPLMAAKIIAETADSTSIRLRFMRATARCHWPSPHGRRSRNYELSRAG
jgi:hypothetical protein